MKCCIMRIKLLVLIIFTLMMPVISTTCSFAHTVSFSDIKSGQSGDIIIKWASKGIISGYGDGTFRPDQKALKAEIIKIINKLLKLDAKADLQFSDISSEKWYANDFLIARRAGYLENSVANIAKPEEELTRKEVAVILLNAFAWDVSDFEMIAFTDTWDLSESEKIAASVMIQNGIMTEYPEGAFMPESTVTRSELIIIFDNINSTGIVSESETILKFLSFSYYDSKSGTNMPYRLYIPDGYPGDNNNQEYPLVLFLHGFDEEGNDNKEQIIANEGALIWAYSEEQKKRPCFVLAPQAPEYAGWSNFNQDNLETYENSSFDLTDSAATAVDIVKYVMDNYRIDRKRIYSTGLSMGAFGLWSINEAYPELFTAMVSVCGGSDLTNVYKVAQKPIWLFHAKEDPVIPVRFSRDIVTALKAAGGDPKYTEYPKGTDIQPNAHFSWILAYNNDEMREWLFSQSK